jgi:hypothetical protein
VSNAYANVLKDGNYKDNSRQEKKKCIGTSFQKNYSFTLHLHLRIIKIFTSNYHGVLA